MCRKRNSSRPLRPLEHLAIAGAIVVACLAVAAPAGGADGVDLRLTRGPLPDQLTLTWSGGQPLFEIYLGTDPAAVVSAANRIGSSSERSFTASQGPAALDYLLVTSPCVVSLPEVCNGRDDDCDGTVDGPGSEISCPALAHATSVCSEGLCAYACDAGFADCNGLAADGCETVVAGAAPCTEAGWPTTRHDNRRTSRSSAVASQSATTRYAKTTAGGTVTPSAATSGPSGHVYFTVSGSLRAIDPATGATVWTALTDSSTTLTAPVVGPDGTIHVARRVTASLEPALIVALDPDGTTIWSTPTLADAWFLSDLAVDGSGRIYGRYDGFGGTSSHRFALDPSGARLWERSCPLPQMDTELPAPAIGRDGGLFLVGFDADGARRLMRIDAADGDILWTAPLTTGNISGPVVADNGLVLVHRPGIDPLGGIHAFDPDSGAQAWFVPYQNLEYGSDNPPVLLSDGTIVAIANGPVAGDRVIYRISPEGSPLGTVPYPSTGYYVKSVVGGDDTMYVWSNQRLMAFSPLDGSVRFRYDEAMTAGCVHSPQPAILSDGSIFLVWRQKQTCNITTGFNYHVTLAAPAP